MTIVPIIVVFSAFQTRICIFSINSISNNNQPLLQDLHMWCIGKHAQSSVVVLLSASDCDTESLSQLFITQNLCHIS